MHLCLGLALTRSARRMGPPAPRIRLSSTAPIPEDTEIGTTLATVSVVNGSGVYTITIVSDPDSKFAIDGDALKLAAAVDYEVATEHSVTLSADNGVDEPISRTFTVPVSNVLEVTLAELTGTFSLPEDAAAGAVAGAISGKTSGSTLTLIDDAGGRAALSGVNILRGLVGLDYATATSHSFTVRETHPDAEPRETTLTLTVTEAGAGGGATFDNADIDWDDTSYTWDMTA